MSNHILTEEQVNKCQLVKDLTEQIRELTSQRNVYQTELLSAASSEEAGTITFTDSSGNDIVKMSVGESLVTDDDGLFKIVDKLKSEGLLHTVITPTFKIDKRAFDRLPDDKRRVLRKYVKSELKKPTLTVL